MIQNAMLIGRDNYGLPEFREPSPGEIDDAQDAIVESYLTGDDSYDLHRHLGEVILERLWKQAQEKKVVPNGQYWDDMVYGAAKEMAAKWSPEEWSQFRGKGA